ncbi:GPI transamidase component PIG-T [Biomphalaria glabrata]|nr:GPI transamidase component PIG-T [Biomphalaria glabrata]
MNNTGTRNSLYRVITPSSHFRKLFRDSLLNESFTMAASCCMNVKSFLLSLILLFTPSSAVGRDEFTEELMIKPLSGGFVYSHFQFTTKWNASIHDSKTFTHFHLFPKSLGEVLKQYGVQELHLSQTQGLWRHKLWGYPVHDAPPGAELWVWFKPSVKDVNSAWTDLVNAVSGLFCSSLNFLDSKSTVIPRRNFQPLGVTSGPVPRYSVRYGSLPKEIVCTENLTPWKKLLPCDSKAGLSTLFNAFLFHDANYHSLGLHVRPVCADDSCTEEAIELTQSLSVVTDVISTSLIGSPNWQLKSLFGNHLASYCPLATRSLIMVDITSNKNDTLFKLTPEPTITHTVFRGQEEHSYATYDVRSMLQSGRAINVGLTYSNNQKLIEATPPPIHAHRFITGHGLEDGGVSCLISNTMPTNQTISYMDVLPWFTRVKFSSLQVTNNGVNVPYKTFYLPAKDRVRPHQLELTFTLWAKSVTKVHFTFTRAFLKWTEYPPDAHHGFHIGAASITANIPSSLEYTAPGQTSSQLSSIFTEKPSDDNPRFFLRIHTETLLVSLPTPDFSMPYNVICLTCTVVAIAFGSIHNLTTRRFIQLDPLKKKGLLSKLKALVAKLRGGQPETKPTSETQQGSVSDMKTEEEEKS